MKGLHIEKPSYRFWFAATAVVALALVYCATAGGSRMWTAACSAAVLVLLALAYRSVRRPLDAMQNGMYLLREQDYSSRLRKVGQFDADRVVELFNRLMEQMKRERLRLEEQNRLLDMLVDASPSGIAICDFDGSIQSRNRAFSEMVTPAVMAVLERLADGESEVCRPGESQILRCSRRYFMDSGFRRSFYIIERLTDEIVQAEKDVFNKMVRTISHEVNNSLGSVVSVLETLGDMHSGDDTVECAVELSRRSCMNLCAFTRAYADVAKLPKPVPEPMDLNAFVRRMLPECGELCASGTALRLDLYEGDVIVQADMMLMERVLVNLVKNAAESIGADGGMITLRTAPRRLTVEDNGRGLSPEAAARVFTPFFSTKHSDRGLGLMLVADILRGHKAAFSLTTSADDGLTRFDIEWP